MSDYLKAMQEIPCTKDVSREAYLEINRLKEANQKAANCMAKLIKANEALVKRWADLGEWVKDSEFVDIPRKWILEEMKELQAGSK